MKHLLYVEDDRIDRMGFARLMSGQELFQVVMAETIQAAARLLETERIDLILSDQYLPDGDYEDMLALARGVPLVVISGLSSGPVNRPGLYAWLQKPLRLAQLVAVWNEIEATRAENLVLDLSYVQALSEGDME
ncbi:MAG: response regulator, partial [Bacteroidetes bacterium]